MRSDAPPPLAQGGRIGVLDSVRGLAALSVLLFHALAFIPALARTLDFGSPAFVAEPSLQAFVLTLTPPSLLWRGVEPVLLFFVLSGFVLSLPFHQNRAPRYWDFIVRRACRLLLPCAASVLAAAVAIELIGPREVPGISEHYNERWVEPVTSSVLFRHLLLLAQDYPLNSSLWTLQHEWLVALVFPLLILLVGAGTRLALAVSLLGIGLLLVERRLLGSQYLLTFFYLPYFVMGALLAKHSAVVVGRIRALGAWKRAGLWTACVLLLVAARPLLPVPDTLESLAVGCGATLLIALVLASPAAPKLLERPAFVWLGRVSFSLYLVHIPVLLAGMRLLPETLPLPVRLVILILTSLALAELAYRTVEQPSAELGRRLTRSSRGPRPARSVPLPGARLSGNLSE